MDLRAITDLEGGRLQSGKLFGPVGPQISHQFQVGQPNPLPIGCGSTFLSPVPLIGTVRALHMRFSSAFTPLHPLPPTAASSAQQRNADQFHISTTDAGSPNDPWDPGVPSAQRQAYTSAAAPPTTPADGPSRHIDRREVMYRVPNSKRSDADRRAGTSDEDEAGSPFIPHHALSDPRSHHPSDPHATHLGHTSGMHVAPRARQIAAHPVRR